MPPGAITDRVVRAHAPATIGNVGAGFDVLGAALQPIDGTLWGDLVEVRLARGCHRFEMSGPYADQLPAGRHNLVVVCRTLVAAQLRRRGLQLPPVELHLTKNLPLCSGLGSSASSVVATLTGLNRFLGEPFASHELLLLAGKAEKTVSGVVLYDNVAPALLGGLQLLTPTVDGHVVPSAIPFVEGWLFVVVHPELEVPTQRARSILPRQLPLTQAVRYWQNLAALIHALHSGNHPLAALTLRDLWIERHRRRLVKGFNQVKQAAFDAGAFACTLSGSGPTMFAVVPDLPTARRVRGSMVTAFGAVGVASDGRICQLDPLGARCL
jgi:homoserine kinase